MNKGISKREIAQICFEYTKLLLEKHGCRVEPFGGIDSEHSMEVWHPSGYRKSSIQVDVESAASETVAVLIARRIGGRKVPVITDYHLVKFIGNDGVYCLEEEKLQQLLLDSKGQTVTGENGRSLYMVFPKQLLLDHCSFIGD